MKTLRTILLAIITLAVSVSCENKATGHYEFYQTGESICNEKPDIFYIVSTNVVNATDSKGNVSYTAQLTETDREYYEMEMDFVKNKISQGDFNFFSPYYHQFTFSSIGLPKEKFDSVYQCVTTEIKDIFNTYIKKYNNGRPFVIAGFSQGAMLAIELLKSMDKETLSKMAGAYIIGYKLTQEDLNHPNITAATNASEPHTAISFNSVLSPEGIWDFLTEGAATCINPVNWTTENVPAELTYNGDTGTVTVDTENNVLIVNIAPEKFRKWMDEHPEYSAFPKDNLHHWDLLFYTEQIHDNALLRVKNL